MANENDAKRDLKLTVGLITMSVVAVAGGSYFLWTWLASPPPEQSRLDLTRVSVASRTNSTESPAYRALLDQFNQNGAAAAKSQNNSFIASIPMEQQAVATPVSVAKPATQKETTSRRNSNSQQQTSKSGDQKDDPRQKALNKLLARINPTVKEEKRSSGLQVAEVIGGASGGSGSGGTMAVATSSYARWSESLPGGARLQTAAMKSGADAPYSAVEVVPPYWRGAGVIDIGVDSDNSTTPVLGKLSGPYAGAVLKAPDGSRLQGDGVVIHFTEMAFKGINYKVDAYALQDDTLLANVASEVNHRYMSRIVLPAILGGIGNISDMYTQANTQVVSNGFSTQVARPETPDGTAVAGAILGGAASQAARVLTADAARTPATQVNVFKGQVVAIQFMRGVYAGDAIAPGRNGESVQSAVPAQAVMATQPQPQAPTQPQSADQWRAQTQARIEAQRRLQENQ
ncbi:conjugal transfer protein TraO [Pseudomonas fluorescens]|uniref:conjugal transfer protein TraO n=1 Tax=Pseudomonas fluorescens TaxID=294 RepID=UPI001BEC52FE|nr:conjugal transfer protein TraO [Pseudomonas fluorescens]MBT2375552.1 conjugal transfer protein TraO [Pseudomonas fluorescens]